MKIVVLYVLNIFYLVFIYIISLTKVNTDEQKEMLIEKLQTG